MTDQGLNSRRQSTVVITGAEGFVGQHLVRELQREWPEVKLVTWDLMAVEDNDWNKTIESVTVDITNPDSYIDSVKQWQPEWIIHLAALASVGDSFKRNDQYMRVNVEGTRQLLEVIEEESPSTRVLIVSSADVYGLAAKEAGCPLPELTISECRPVNPYATSKLEMEKIIAEKYREKCIVVRPFPHIGPGQGRGFVTADFASQIAAIEGGQNESVIRVGSLEVERDFTDVRDVVKAYRLLIKSGELGQTYNISSGKAVAIKQILDGLLALSSVEISVQQDPGLVRPIEIPSIAGDYQRLAKAVGWRAAIKLEQTLQDIMDDWRARIKEDGKADID